MAGYMTKQLHNVYEGELVNGTGDKVQNGTLLVLNTAGDKLVLPTADTTSKIQCIEKTTIYDGIEAYRFRVNSVAKLYYLVDNQPDYNDSEAYDARHWKTEDGKLLRAHPLQAGQEFVATTTETVAVGTAYGVKATGMIG